MLDAGRDHLITMKEFETWLEPALARLRTPKTKKIAQRAPCHVASWAMKELHLKARQVAATAQAKADGVNSMGTVKGLAKRKETAQRELSIANEKLFELDARMQHREPMLSPEEREVKYIDHESFYKTQSQDQIDKERSFRARARTKGKALAGFAMHTQKDVPEEKPLDKTKLCFLFASHGVTVSNALVTRTIDTFSRILVCFLTVPH